MLKRILPVTNEAALSIIAGILSKTREDYLLLEEHGCLKNGLPTHNPPGLTTDESFSAAIFVLTLEDHLHLFQLMCKDISLAEVKERFYVKRNRL